MERSHRHIEETMNSLEGMQRAQAPDYLLGRIEQRLGGNLRVKGRIVPLRTVGLAAACIALLVLLNMAALHNWQQDAHAPQATMQDVARDYGFTGDNTMGL